VGLEVAFGKSCVFDLVDALSADVEIISKPLSPPPCESSFEASRLTKIGYHSSVRLAGLERSTSSGRSMQRVDKPAPGSTYSVLRDTHLASDARYRHVG
jgi:hypothetical protein